MNFSKKLFFVFFIFISIISFSKNIVENSKDLKIKKLNNGITYYYYNNKRLEDRVSINVVIKSGSLQEEENQKGIAHFLEHMVFNGTKSYEKNGIVKYFESIGLSFGGDLNAHTSFYETVYKLQLPTDDKEKFEEGVKILKEMIFDATLTDEDINDEKEIVVEEWRLSQGFRERITSFWKKVIYDESRYNERFPIGDMEIIKNADHNLVKSYYDKWYRPENIGIILVGDINERYAEKIIKKYFNFSDNKKYTKPQVYGLKELPNDYLIFKDKEIIIPEFTMLFRLDNDNNYTEESIKESIALKLLKNLIENRLTKKSLETPRNILSGSSDNDLYIKDNLFSISTMMEENKISEGIEETVNVLKYFKEFEISNVELSLEKENILKILENEVKNKNSFSNSLLVKDISKAFINNDVFLNVEDSYELYKKYSSDISVKDIKALATKIYNDNTRFVLLLPENSNISKEEFKEIVTKGKNSIIKKDDEKELNLTLKEPLLPVGHIKSINNKDNYKEIILSNNIKFLYKYTNLKEDTIYFKLFREGGISNLSYSEMINSYLASNLINSSGVENINVETLDAYFKGKNFKISPRINNYSEEISITSEKSHLNEALKYFSYLVRNPKLSSNLYDVNMSSLKLFVKNKNNNPSVVFDDKITELFYNNHPYKTSLSQKDLIYFSEENMLEVFSKKFKNFNGYSGIVVGNIKERELIPLLEKYFASLPTDIPYNDSWKNLDIPYPNNIVTGSVIKGNDKKISVNINYPIYKDYSLENERLISAITKILRITFIEEVREKISGVYGISVNSYFSKYEKGYLNIYFSTDPKKEKMVLDKIHSEIDKILKGYINERALNSILKNYKITYENNLEMNNYWINYLTNKITLGENYRTLTPKEYNSLITKENLKNFEKDLLKSDNYIQVILYPENEN